MEEQAYDYAVEMINITKRFPGIIANDNITLKIKKGEIHALLGENGAGKSTLMSVLFGLYSPEEGYIKINGERVNISNPNVATKYGIGMVHQHFKLVECFSVLENIILGVEPTKFGFLNMDLARKKIIALSKKYNLGIDVNKKIENISVGMQQRVEILKMLYRDNDILIFDEPTAVLTPQEIEELMQIMEGFKKEGKSILFITHKLSEIKQVADRCSVLRKGKYIGTYDVKNITKEELSNKMVGRNVDFNIHKSICSPGKTLLKVRNLYVRNELKKRAVKKVSFDLKQGEILCIAGIEGNGQRELIYGLTGLFDIEKGSVKFENTKINDFSISKRNSCGIAHIPEDRHKHGLILDFNLANNLALKEIDTKYQKYGFIDFYNLDQNAKKLIKKYDIRSSNGPQTITRSMSGGNQQKAIIARELETKPKLLIAVQPTRGLDVGAIENIHKQILQARDNNVSVLLVSLELDEVMQLSDRILVMHSGKIVGEKNPKKTSVEELGLYMAGIKSDYKFGGDSIE